MAGDDHACKSSTLPCASDVAFYDANIPVLFPGNPQEVLELGLHGYAMSRYSGLWVGIKMVTNIADGGGIIDVHPDPPCSRVPCECEIFDVQAAAGIRNGDNCLRLNSVCCANPDCDIIACPAFLIEVYAAVCAN